MQLSNRQMRFIVAAFLCSNKGEFDWNAVAKKLGISEDEAQDTTMALANLGLFSGMAFGSTSVVMEAEARELARDLIDNGHGEGLT